MDSKIRRPGWWALFVLLIGMLGLILLESQDGVPNTVHEMIDSVIVVGFFGTLLGWLHLNRSDLEEAELEHTSLSEFHVVEYEPRQSGLASKQFVETRFLVESGEALSLTETHR
jgi:hypothetical protein